MDGICIVVDNTVITLYPHHLYVLVCRSIKIVGKTSLSPPHFHPPSSSCAYVNSGERLNPLSPLPGPCAYVNGGEWLKPLLPPCLPFIW